MCLIVYRYEEKNLLSSFLMSLEFASDFRRLLNSLLKYEAVLTKREEAVGYELVYSV